MGFTRMFFLLLTLFGLCGVVPAMQQAQAEESAQAPYAGGYNSPADAGRQRY